MTFLIKSYFLIATQERPVKKKHRNEGYFYWLAAVTILLCLDLLFLAAKTVGLDRWSRDS